MKKSLFSFLGGMVVMFAIMISTNIVIGGVSKAVGNEDDCETETLKVTIEEAIEHSTKGSALHHALEEAHNDQKTCVTLHFHAH